MLDRLPQFLFLVSFVAPDLETQYDALPDIANTDVIP